MLKWLFGKREPEKRAEAERFDASYLMILERAAALKKEYERTRMNAEITANIKAYEDPEYITTARDTIFSTMTDEAFKPAHGILPVVASSFMTMATEMFPSDRGFEQFSAWADGFSAAERRELVRFAYIATVSEQELSGTQHPVSFAMRIVLMALAANANDDQRSKAAARTLMVYIDKVRERRA